MKLKGVKTAADLVVLELTMSTFNSTTLATNLLAVALFSHCALALSAEPTLPELRRALDENHYDSYLSTKGGFLKATQALEKYVADHPSDRDAQRLLAEAYGEWAIVYLKPTHPEYETKLNKRREIYESLLRYSPDDARLLYDYSFALENSGERVKVLNRAHQLVPEDTEIEFRLGLMYHEGLRQSELGLRHMRHAFDQAEGGLKTTIGDRLARLLDGNNHEEAIAVRRALEEYRKASSGLNKPQPKTQ
jgi:hypothetical protein